MLAPQDTTLPQPPSRVGLIGLGEVGTIFARALAQLGVAWVGGWDVKLTPGHPEADAMRARAVAAGATVCADVAALCAQAQLIISAVTAANTLAAAELLAAQLRPGTWVLDLNSASPGTKQQAAAAIEATGGRYVEAGVMTSVPPYGVRVPMLLGGPHAAALAPVLQGWGMQVQVASDRYGVASATKMCRSVIIKGLEALVIESFTAARHYGVEDAMIATLHETFPGIDWAAQAAYFYSRVAQHGQRRAEEMREVARTVVEAGFEPVMADATARKDDGMAALRRAGALDHVAADAPWQVWADALLAARASKTTS
ncbi:NAD(P)-dependent oxidoreductase [Tepidimonas aquatica]|uniref:HIBADH: 3-hydroxyisobutyrate dehydrogenase n=1 Tax=Tepidimonas aquatica TaxID=247482 RepID=A0A554WIT5_9BURK|nr:NAD(P)-dependent oxidoreductase [Tepidimonas aquatica]TSE23488.1 HIBADH: 3-hydroxyisobutyrate dehydrogenase [Tepidimonas aquatica]